MSRDLLPDVYYVGCIIKVTSCSSLKHLLRSAAIFVSLILALIVIIKFGQFCSLDSFCCWNLVNDSGLLPSPGDGTLRLFGGWVATRSLTENDVQEGEWVISTEKRTVVQDEDFPICGPRRRYYTLLNSLLLGDVDYMEGIWCMFLRA